MRCSPYVEWYQNSIAIEGSPAALHHAEVHGNRPYDDFVETFLDGHARLAGRPVGRPVRGRRCAVRGAGHQAPRRRPALAERHTQPAQAAVGERARSRRRPRRGGAGARPALRHLLLRRPRLDLRRSADPRLRGDARRHPADAGVPRLRRRALDRAHRAVRARRALERHRLPGRGRPAGAVRALLRGGAPRRGEQPVRLDRPDRRAPCTATSSRPSTPPRAARPGSGRAPAASAPASATTARKTSRPTSRPTRWCGCSSTSSPTAATCSSTSAPTPTARSRGCRRSGCWRSAGGSARTATPSTAPAPGPGPTARPARGTTSATRRETARCSPSSAARPVATWWSSTSPRSRMPLVHLLGHDAALPWEATGAGCRVTLPVRPAEAPALALRLTGVSP